MMVEMTTPCLVVRSGREWWWSAHSLNIFNDNPHPALYTLPRTFARAHQIFRTLDFLTFSAIHIPNFACAPRFRQPCPVSQIH